MNSINSINSINYSINLWSDNLIPYAQGQRATVGGLKHQGLLQQLQQYKRQIAKRYRVIESGQMERILPHGDLWISPKLDGELWFLVKMQGQLALCTYNGRVILDIPLLKDWAARCADTPDFLIAGELTAAIAQGRPRSHHLATAFADEQYAGHLAFHAFDLVSIHGTEASGWGYGERLAQLKTWLGDAAVITTVVGDLKQALIYYREWVASGHHEGLVVRSMQNVTYKIKPVMTLDAVVVAYGARLVGDTPQLREMSVALMRDDGSYQLLGSVGNGFSEDDRVAWLQRLQTLECDSHFRMANSEGTLSRFVRPECVIEIRCTDWLISDAEDQAIYRMNLAYDADQGGYRALGERTTAVMLFPAFLRERTDKRVDAGDVGMDQILRRVQWDEAQIPLTQATDASNKAEIVARKVWSKTTKGLVSVRKVVLIQTHRQASHEAPFVVFGTDYSPNRAEPLQTTLRTASSLATAQTQMQVWIDDNIKKGWQLVSG